MNQKFNYRWTLKDTKFTENKGKVFSCFACGGGSTMGYKLAGFKVIGFNEIDPKMANIYIKNHRPEFQFVEAIQDFVRWEEFPPRALSFGYFRWFAALYALFYGGK